MTNTDARGIRFSELLRAGDLIVTGSGVGEPESLVRALDAQREHLDSVQIFAGISYTDAFTPELATAAPLSSFGAMGTIAPLAAAGLIDTSRGIICEVKVGSSEGGAASGDSTHHPERSGVMRSFAPTGHRHTAEVLQALALKGVTTEVHLSATAVDNVRGVLATAHVFVKPGTVEKDVWKAYREAYNHEPFVRIVKERTGLYRYPEPKILSGSNYADVGFELDAATGRVVALCAIDNLMKGAAGTAMQCANIMMGWDETLGLDFPGLHPI